MKFYCIKRRQFFESEPILIVGPINDTIKRIVDFGFLESMVHLFDGNSVPKNRPFIVSETTPENWAGEIINAKDFAATMRLRRFVPEKNKISRAMSAISGVSGCPVTQCQFAEPGELVSPCRGRKITCRHPENDGVVRLEIACQPPDPSKDFEYNLRTCRYHAD